jgi:murein DD-endopeptidase MepM/ murein hydrolase activator NlpD
MKRIRPVTFGPVRVDTSARQRQNQLAKTAGGGNTPTAKGAVNETGVSSQHVLTELQGERSGVSERKSDTDRKLETVRVRSEAPKPGMAPAASVYRATSQRASHAPPLPPLPRNRSLATRLPPKPIRLETSYLDQPHHHRWLMTTCIVGVVGTLLFGGLTLGIFGQPNAMNEAVAAVQPEPLVNRNKVQSADNLAMARPVQTASIADTKRTEVKSAEIIPEQSLDNGFSYPEITEDELPYGAGETAVFDSELQAVESVNENITDITKTPPAEPVDERFRLTGKKSLVQELMARGVSRAAAQALVAKIEPIIPVKMIKPGTEIELTLDKQIDFYGREAIFPVELAFKPGPKETVTVEADEDGGFIARIEGKGAKSKSLYAQVNQLRARARVGSSLYATAKDNRIPDYIVSEFTRVFSYDVDFQRQIAATDSFELFFGAPLSGSSSKRKVLHYAELTFDGRTKSYYRFTSADGQTDYYDENGRSAGRALLKTPISGARLTSRFGMRRHPLLGYSKMHTGNDFGAPTGTPIRAAGSGVIDLAGRHGAYGITVVLKHTSKYKTLYAHMSRLAAGVRAGSRVNQGQIIGYVGSTGRSSGPHLHYEVRINNRPVNPTAIRAQGGKQLAGSDLARFRQTKARVVAMMKDAPSASQVAQVTP